MALPNDDIPALRRYFALTQPELADYLGLSRTMLAHVEAGRRNLPPEAMARLSPLLGLMPPPYGSGPANQPALPPDSAEDADPEAESLRIRLGACHHEASNLAYRLRQLQRRAEPLRRRRALPALLAALPPAAPLRPELLGVPLAPPSWGQYVTALAELALPRYGRLSQGLLEARLAGLATEAAHLEALLATLSPPTAAPPAPTTAP